jgi:hypothetical protein
MSFPRGRGRIVNVAGQASVVARCPLCGEEHRYAKGAAGGDEIAEIRKQGFTDEWLPCQVDLPGNFWRVVISGGRQGGKSSGSRRARGAKTA